LVANKSWLKKGKEKTQKRVAKKMIAKKNDCQEN
jgi:hypothetical protein